MKLYKHKKTGNYYTLVSDQFMIKNIIESKRIYTADSFEMEFEDSYKWNHIKHILYRAEYDCPDGPYFARLPEDFYEQFIPIKFKRKDSQEDYGLVYEFEYIKGDAIHSSYYRIYDIGIGYETFYTIEDFLEKYDEVKL